MPVDMVQVKVEVQAFLTMPDLAAMQSEQIDHCQVINPFSIETAVDHCVEPTTTGTYRSAVTFTHSSYARKPWPATHNQVLVSAVEHALQQQRSSKQHCSAGACTMYSNLVLPLQACYCCSERACL